MEIYTRCSRCRKKIPVGKSCPCYSKGRERQGRLDVDAFYHSSEWWAARARAIRRTFGLDIVAFYERKEIITGFTVHHIEPLETGWELRAEPDNLIYLTEQNHRLIHERYLKDFEQTKKYLHELITRFDEEYGKDRKL